MDNEIRAALQNQLNEAVAEARCHGHFAIEAAVRLAADIALEGGQKERLERELLSAVEAEKRPARFVRYNS